MVHGGRLVARPLCQVRQGVGGGVKPQVSEHAPGHLLHTQPNSALNFELPTQVGTNVSRHD